MNSMYNAGRGQLSGSAALLRADDGDRRRREASLPYLIDAVNARDHERPHARRTPRAPRSSATRSRSAAKRISRKPRSAGTHRRSASRACAPRRGRSIKNDDFSLVSATGFQSQWPQRLWDLDKYHHYNGDGGAYGVGYGMPSAVGAALAARDQGRYSVNFQGDGDLMVAPGSLWTAAHHKIPLLTIMHNNRAWHQETMHVQRMADRREREPEHAQGRHADRRSRDRLREARAVVRRLRRRRRSRNPRSSGRRSRARSRSSRAACRRSSTSSRSRAKDGADESFDRIVSLALAAAAAALLTAHAATAQTAPAPLDAGDAARGKAELPQVRLLRVPRDGRRKATTTASRISRRIRCRWAALIAVHPPPVGPDAVILGGDSARQRRRPTSGPTCTSIPAGKPAGEIPALDGITTEAEVARTAASALENAAHLVEEPFDRALMAVFEALPQQPAVECRRVRRRRGG